jgi:hypothetical protein
MFEYFSDTSIEYLLPKCSVHRAQPIQVEPTGTDSIFLQPTEGTIPTPCRQGADTIGSYRLLAVSNRLLAVSNRLSLLGPA